MEEEMMDDMMMAEGEEMMEDKEEGAMEE